MTSINLVLLVSVRSDPTVWVSRNQDIIKSAVTKWAKHNFQNDVTVKIIYLIENRGN